MDAYTPGRESKQGRFQEEDRRATQETIRKMDSTDYLLVLSIWEKVLNVPWAELVNHAVEN